MVYWLLSFMLIMHHTDRTIVPSSQHQYQCNVQTYDTVKVYMVDNEIKCCTVYKKVTVTHSSQKCWNSSYPYINAMQVCQSQSPQKRVIKPEKKSDQLRKEEQKKSKYTTSPILDLTLSDRSPQVRPFAYLTNLNSPKSWCKKVEHRIF